MAPYNRTETSGKYSQPLSISRAQQTVATAALAHGMLGYFIIVPETRQAEREEGERPNVAWKIVCYEAILASEPSAAHTHTDTLYLSLTHTL